MAIFEKKSALDKIKALLGELSEEELEEFKKMLLGEEEAEEAPAEEESTEEEVKEEEVKEEAEESEEGADEEIEEKEEEKEEVEEPADEEPKEEVIEEKEEVVEEEPTPEPAQPEEDKSSILEARIQELSDAFNNLLAKVEPILSKFAEVDNDTNGAGMAKPNSITPGEDEDLTADEWARKHAIY